MERGKKKSRNQLKKGEEEKKKSKSFNFRIIQFCTVNQSKRFTKYFRLLLNIYTLTPACC